MATLLAIESFGGYGAQANVYERTGYLAWVNGSLSLSSGTYAGTQKVSIAATPLHGSIATPRASATVGWLVTPENGNNITLDIVDSAAGQSQCSLNCNTGNGSISFYSHGAYGSGGQTLLGSTSNNVFNAAVPFLLEVNFTISATVGTCTIVVNGVQQLALAGLNTKVSANANFDTLYFGDGTTIENVYLADTGFLGGIFAPYEVPTANGTEDDFTPSSGTNYQNVNSTVSQIVNNNSSGTAGNIDNFQVTTYSGTAPIGVEVKVFAAKDFAGTATIAPYCELGGTVALGTTFGLTTTPTLYTYLFLTDPNSAAWTTANFNLARFGYKRVA